jgi:DNA-directed RNA polymerase subunit RPC12/RpoP
MSLVKCRECGKDVSNKAEACPNCGIKIQNPKMRKLKTVFKVMAGLIILFGFIGVLSKDKSEKDKRDSEPVLSEKQKKLKNDLQLFSNKRWPFEFNKVSIGCYEDFGPNSVLRVEDSATSNPFFGLNGKASRYLPSVREISIKDDVGVSLSFQYFIDVANSLCENQETYWYTLTYNPDTSMLNMIESSEVIKAPRQVILEKVQGQFSLWNGEHIELSRILKKQMHDPDSYEHEETVYWIRKDHLVIRTTYRGNNTFGGKVKGLVKAKVSFDGEVLEFMK